MEAGLKETADHLDVVMLLAGLAHDIGHPGFTNAYLIETSHPFATRFNDQSPLEMFHAFTGLEIASARGLWDSFSGKDARTGRLYARRADSPLTNRGGAAAATWIFRGGNVRRRRGCDVDIPWRPRAAAPRRRRGYSVEATCGAAAVATTWMGQCAAMPRLRR